MELAETGEGLMDVPFSPGPPREVIEHYQRYGVPDRVHMLQKPFRCRGHHTGGFFRYLKRAAGYRSEEHLKAWLIRVAMSMAKNLLRKLGCLFPQDRR